MLWGGTLNLHICSMLQYVKVSLNAPQTLENYAHLSHLHRVAYLWLFPQIYRLNHNEKIFYSENMFPGNMFCKQLFEQKDRTQWHDAARILILFLPHAKTNIFSCKSDDPQSLDYLLCCLCCKTSSNHNQKTCTHNETQLECFRKSWQTSLEQNEGAVAPATCLPERRQPLW